MIMAEKLIKSFGVYFIVLACLTFIYNFADLINNLLIITGKGGLSLYGGLSQNISVLNWAIPIVAIIGAFLLFFTGIFVFKLKETSAKWIIISSLAFMLK